MNAHATYPDDRRVAQHIHQLGAYAQQCLGRSSPALVALALIDLPVLPDVQIADARDGEILHAVAPLYFAMEVEMTGLTAALSRVAGYYASGGLRLPRGPVASKLISHHREYETRRPSDDRYAAYLRLFGSAPEGAVPFAMQGGVNGAFDEDMLQLAEALHRYASLPATELSPNVARREIARAARSLAMTLLAHAGGATHYLADEALALIQRATDIFGDRSLQTALGSARFWDAVSASLSTGHGRPGFRDPSLTATARQHLARGRAGMILIEWVASQLSDLGGVSQLRLDRSDPVLTEGTRWLEATLDLLSQAEAMQHGL